MKTSRPSLHYGWHIVWTGTLCILGCLGLGRFAIGMLLPAMGKALQLGYSEMGLISTMNFTGYLISVLICGSLAAKFGSRLVIFAAMALIALSMFFISHAVHLWQIIILYMLTGMGSGAANVPMMALVSRWFGPSSRGRAAGFVVIGSGLAILLSGRLVPYLNSTGGPEGWRLSWQVLSAIVFVIAVICLVVIRNSPEEKGLHPYGGPKTGPETALPEVSKPEITKKEIMHLGAIYFLFGYTYVIYATFIVTFLIQEKGFSENTAGQFWAWIGLLSLVSGPVFGTMSDRTGRKTALITVFLIQTAAYVLAGWGKSDISLYLSIGCYGIVAWSIPSIMAALVGDYAGPQKAARIFGFITFIFAMGQISGPAIAGMLAENFAGFSTSFFMAAAFTAVAAVLSGMLKR